MFVAGLPRVPGPPRWPTRAVTAMAPPAAPAWAASAVSRRWIEIPGNALASVDPGAGPWQVGGAQVCVVQDWNGAGFDAANGVVWFTGLGGHGNYCGNEIYRWDLNQTTPAFSMVLGPSSLGDYTTAAGTADQYSDGRPRSTHSYNCALHIPGVGPALMGLPARSTDGGDTRRPITFDETTGAATFRTAPSNSGFGFGSATSFDSTRGSQGSVWYSHGGTSVMQRYDVAADSWSNHGAAQAFASARGMAIHPSGAYILFGEGDPGFGQSIAGGWAVFDCTAETWHFPTFSGAPAVNNPGTGGLWPGLCQPTWVPNLGAFCAWDNDTSRTLITTLAPGADPRTDAWTVSTLAVDGGNTVTPSAAQGNGTYGRFQYWPAGGGFVLLNAASGPGYFFKL